MICTIKNSYLTANINTLGAELVSVKNPEGKEYIFQPAPIWPGQAKNLFPNVAFAKDDYAIIRGVKYPMNQHGFAKDTEFEVNQVSESEIEFTMASSENTRKYVPYEFTLTIAFSLEENTVKQRYKVHNLDGEEMYFGIACHTGFASTLESYVDFGCNDDLIELCRKHLSFITGDEIPYPTEDGKLPVVPRTFGNVGHVLRNFKEKKLTLVNPELKSSVEIKFDDFQYITLWSTEPADTVLCMMPWCALPDSVDSDHIFENKKGNVKLEARETFVADQYFTFTDN